MSKDDITGLLKRWHDGDDVAKNQLFDLVYMELKKISHKHLQKRNRRYLQTTELVHEAYLKIVQQNKLGEHRGEFYKLVSIIMRRIIIDLARKHHNDAALLEEPLDNQFSVKLGERVVHLIDINNALTKLAKREPRQAKILEMRFFAGFNTEQIAEAMNIGSATVKRDVQRAKTWVAFYFLNDDSSEAVAAP